MQISMKARLAIVSMALLVCSLAQAGQAAPKATAPSSQSSQNSNGITVYQDPYCGCCSAWSQHMQDSGFQVNTILSSDMAAVKQKLGVPTNLQSCHTAVLPASGQVIEGHVPASVVRKMQAQPKVRGVAAPGMPHNAPGMGQLDGKLVTVDFAGQAFSRD